MSARTYSTIIRTIAVILGAVIAVSIALQVSLYVPLVAGMVGMVAVVVCRRFVREVMADERSRSIEERATSMAFRIFTVAAAAFSLVALMLRSNLPEWAFTAGTSVAYAVCGLMLVQSGLRWYYARKS